MNEMRPDYEANRHIVTGVDNIYPSYHVVEGFLDIREISTVVFLCILVLFSGPIYTTILVLRWKEFFLALIQSILSDLKFWRKLNNNRRNWAKNRIKCSGNLFRWYHFSIGSWREITDAHCTSSSSRRTTLRCGLFLTGIFQCCSRTSARDYVASGTFRLRLVLLIWLGLLWFTSTISCNHKWMFLGKKLKIGETTAFLSPIIILYSIDHYKRQASGTKL